MFLTCLVRAAVAFSIATVLANADFALAAEQSVTTIAATDCEAVAKSITRATGIPLTIKWECRILRMTCAATPA